jgi:hypothetical protein
MGQLVPLQHGEEWPRRFKLTVALCDGAPARLQAGLALPGVRLVLHAPYRLSSIEPCFDYARYRDEKSQTYLRALMASFRDMQPYLLHMWQLKSFWHQGKLCENDVDIQRWEQAEAMPPIPADIASLNSFFAAGGGSEGEGDGRGGGGSNGELIARMVEEMKLHRDVFMNMERGGHELSTFWLRKTQKPVLAVLCVRRRRRDDEPGGLPEFEFHRVGKYLKNRYTYQVKPFNLSSETVLPLK